MCDTGKYRNAASHGVHGFLSRDGILPSELLEISRGQLDQYGVELCNISVSRIEGSLPEFVLTLGQSETKTARRLLLATGVSDKLPPIRNIDRFYGSSVHHCPYCDAWEHRDQPLAVYGKGRPAMGLALSLLTWSADVAVCTDGPHEMRREHRAELEKYSISLFPQKIESLEGEGGSLERIVFRNGESIGRQAIFFNTGQVQACSLGTDLNCALTTRGVIKTDKFEKTSVPGIYAAGDCSRNAQFVSVATAQGTIAAEAINIELQEEDRRNFLFPSGARL